LFGSCGEYGDLNRGDLVMIDKAYNLESFSKMLNFDKIVEYYESSKDLLYDFYKKNLYEDLIKTNSACVSSLALEVNFLDLFKEKEISAIDMESSIILAASQAINRNAACFMYVTDLIGKDIMLSKEEKSIKQRIASSRKKLADILLRFCDEQ
jgi:purine-nucleoside phosphorylase